MLATAAPYRALDSAGQTSINAPSTSTSTRADSDVTALPSPVSFTLSRNNKVLGAAVAGGIIFGFIFLSASWLLLRWLRKPRAAKPKKKDPLSTAEKAERATKPGPMLTKPRPKAKTKIFSPPPRSQSLHQWIGRSTPRLSRFREHLDKTPSSFSAGSQSNKSLSPDRLRPLPQPPLRVNIPTHPYAFAAPTASQSFVSFGSALTSSVHDPKIEAFIAEENGAVVESMRKEIDHFIALQQPPTPRPTGPLPMPPIPPRPEIKAPVPVRAMERRKAVPPS